MALLGGNFLQASRVVDFCLFLWQARLCLGWLCQGGGGIKAATVATRLQIIADLRGGAWAVDCRSTRFAYWLLAACLRVLAESVDSGGRVLVAAQNLIWRLVKGGLV